MKLYLIVCGLAFLYVQVFLGPPDLGLFDKFKQDDYKLKFERLEAVSHNKSIINYLEIKTFKYNRTWAVVNATFEFKINVGKQLEFVIQFYKFMSNEYRYFPLRLQVNICLGFDKNLAGVEGFLKCGNFSGCPIPQGKLFRTCNWAPDGSRLPPFIPDGKYMIEFQMLYVSTEAAVFRVFAEVYRPIYWEK